MRASVGIALVAMVIGTNAFAQDQNGAPPPGTGRGAAGFMQACGSDAQSLCPMAQTPKDMHMCIRKNRQKISPPCSSFLAQRRAERLQQMESQPAQQPPGQPAAPPNQYGPAQPAGQAPPPPG